MTHPVVVDALVLALMGLSGVAAGLLLGVRQWIPLTFLAVALSTVVRTWSAFAMWSLGMHHLITDAWIVASIALVVVGGALAWRHWRIALLATSALGAASVVALTTKYVLAIGERHHTDSANAIAVAVVGLGGEVDNLDPIAGSAKRGIAYPLMLGLGPEGRVLAGFTPLLFMMILLAVGWIAWQILRDTVRPQAFWIAVGSLGLFSLSVPIFRAAMFYLNAHILMGFAMVLLVGGLLLARQQRSFSGLPLLLTLVGGVIGVTARVEGIVLVLALLVALVGQSWWSSSVERMRLFATLAIVGITFTWWLSSTNSPLIERFGLTSWILVVLSLVGAALAASPWIDRLRGALLPLFAAAVVGVLLGGIAMSANPLAQVLAQWPNLGLGRGGWATAAHVFIGSVVLLGFFRRSLAYRWLLGISALMIVTILFSKGFDGGSFSVGFGREGFYDSVNRMWLHVMPTIMVMTIVGYAELLHSAFFAKHRADRGGQTADRQPLTVEQ